MEMSCTTQTAPSASPVTIVRNYLHMRVSVSHTVPVATIRGRCLELPIVWLPFQGGNYLRAVSLFEEIR